MLKKLSDCSFIVSRKSMERFVNSTIGLLGKKLR